MVKWQFDHITAEISGTNIERIIFKKRDFFEDLYNDYVENGAGKTPLNKREIKQKLKQQSQAGESSEITDEWEEKNDKVGLLPGQKLTSFKTSNSMNNMLPSVKTAHEEAA